jgi:site-specific recombinase XerD
MPKPAGRFRPGSRFGPQPPATSSGWRWKPRPKACGRAVQRVLKRYGQEAGLNELTPHIARHTFAKNLVNQGVGLEKVASLLGHSSLNTTRLYTTPNQHDLELAVEKLEK